MPGGGGGIPSLYELYVGMYEAKLKGMVFEPFQSELWYRVLLFWSEMHSLSSGPKLRMLFTVTGNWIFPSKSRT